MWQFKVESVPVCYLNCKFYLKIVSGSVPKEILAVWADVKAPTFICILELNPPLDFPNA